ncbi:hypothetical protein ACFW04_014147 [Cataglyphis niger]
MGAELNTLLNVQRDIHGRMSRSAQHELIRLTYKERYNENEYATDFVDTVENIYVQQRATPSTSAASNEQQNGDRLLKSALPKIKLPPFSGARRLANSVVSPIERFHYLRSCLQGPAEKLIQSLTVIGKNYNRAWEILKKHFENKEELIRSNFATFTAVAKMNGEIAEELSRVYHAVTTAMNTQESIGRPIESHAMDLFSHLVVEHFDARTRLEWESTTSDSFEPPNHDILLNFIIKRMLTLNAAKSKTIKVSGDSPRSVKTHFTKNESNAP